MGLLWLSYSTLSVDWENKNDGDVKGRLVGLFQHCSWRLIVLLPPNEFLHSSPEAPRTIQAQETSASEGRKYYQGIQLANPEFMKVLGSFTCHKGGKWDRFFHFPSEGRHAEDYSDTQKVQQLWPGLNPRTWVSEASMLTTRPPRPLIGTIMVIIIMCVHTACTLYFSGCVTTGGLPVAFRIARQLCGPVCVCELWLTSGALHKLLRNARASVRVGISL